MNPHRIGWHRAVWPALLALLLALAAVVAGGGAAREASAQGTPAYLDASLDAEQRADDLLPRMSLAEKIGQMTQINATVLQGDRATWDRAALNPAIMEDVFGPALTEPGNLTGSILSGGGASPLVNSPRAWAQMTNEIQEFAMARQPHGIPIIYGIDAVHGHNNVLGATMFPHQFGLGALTTPAWPASSLTPRRPTCARRASTGTSLRWRTSGATCAGAARTSPSARRRSPRATWSPRRARARGRRPPLAGGVDHEALHRLLRSRQRTRPRERHAHRARAVGRAPADVHARHRGGLRRR